MARRSARRRWGDIGGFKYIHLRYVLGSAGVVQHARYLVYDKGRRIAPRIPPGQSECSQNPIEICWAVHAMACNEGCRNSLRGFAARCWLRVAGCWLLVAGCWLLATG